MVFDYDIEHQDNKLNPKGIVLPSGVLDIYRKCSTRDFPILSQGQGPVELGKIVLFGFYNYS